MLKKLFKGNIFTDFIWLLVGIAGGINFYLKSRYWAAGVFAFLAILYLIKIASHLFKGLEVSSDAAAVAGEVAPEPLYVIERNSVLVL